MRRLQLRISTSVLLIVISALVLSQFVQYRRATRREAQILQREAALQSIMYERISKLSHENEALRQRIDQLQFYVERESIPVRNRLPGIDVSIEDARKQSDIIAVARLVSFGPSSSGRGYAWYRDVDLKLMKVLTGALGDRDLPRISFSVHQREELLPERGEEYIFFIKKSDRGHRAIKVLRHSRENLQALGDIRGQRAGVLPRPTALVPPLNP
jgi:hypothetical protein